MHMAFALLTPHARQLKALGLKFLVTPEECPYSPCAVRRDQPATARPAARPAAPASETRYTPPPRPASWNRGAQYGQNARQVVRPQGQIQEQGQARSGSDSYAAAPAGNTAADIAWPEDWQKLLARTKSARFCWTYTDLGYDLSGYASPERRKYLQELLAFMRLPKGSSTFWPVGLPKKGSDGSITLDIRPDLFWAGVDKLGIRFIIFLDSGAAAKTGCTGIRNSHGCVVLAVQDININSFAIAQNMETAKNFIRSWIWHLPGA